MPEFDSSIEYRDVPGFPGYKACSDGTIWSCRTFVGLGPGKGSKGILGTKWIKLKPGISRQGRLFVYLHPGKKHYAVHRLVLFAFVGPCPPGMECRHFPERDPKNCRIENLSWGTRKQNHADKKIHGTSNCGEKQHDAKLTADQVKEIRRSYSAWEFTQVGLAKKYGVRQTTISCILRRVTWKHVA